jgi:tetratricopeptide (TPR) repeat protein
MVLIVQAALLALAAWFVYARSAGGAWIWDDPVELAQNPDLRDSSGLARIWSGSAGIDYLPLKATVQWLGWRVWGDHPAGYHWLNIGLHLAGALVFWRVLRRLGASGFGAWLGALFFVVHPVAVESVAWVSELKNTLSLVFYLLALDAALDWVGIPPSSGRPRRPAPYALSLSWYVAALLCKGSAVMLPAVILLCAWWRRGRVCRRDLAACLPFAAVALASGCATLWFQEHRAIAAASLGGAGPAARIGEAGLAVAFYLIHCVLPVAMAPVYPHWFPALGMPAALLPWLGLAGAAWWLGTLRSPSGRCLRLGLGFFAINLLPVIGLAPMAYLRISWVADHFAYLSLLGIAGLAGAGIGAWHAAAGAGGRRAATALAAVLALALAGEARAYAGVFRDNRTLWTEALRRNPGAWIAHDNLGRVLFLDGEIARAGAEFLRAEALFPGDANVHANLGLFLADTGRPAEAIGEYDRALRLNPALAAALDGKGGCLLGLGRLSEAIGAYRGAIRLDPLNPRSHANLGVALAGSGRIAEAAAEFAESVRLNPGGVEARYNLGIALAGLGRNAEAIPQFEEVVRIRPGYRDAQRYLDRIRGLSDGAK